MKTKLLTAIVVLAMAAVASADILVPNGDFSAGQGTWINDGAAVITYAAIGGNPGGYADMDSTGGNWGVLVIDATLAQLGGVTIGSTQSFTFDMFGVAGGELAGMKVEAWDAGAMISNFTGDTKFNATTGWLTYTTPDIVVPAGTTFFKFVPLSVDSGHVGFDNVGIVSVIPEPATMGLFALAGGLLMFVRRFRS